MAFRDMIQNYRKPQQYPWQGGPIGTGGNPGPGGGHTLPAMMPQVNLDRPGQQNLMDTGNVAGEGTGGGYGNSFLGTFMNLAKWAVPYAGREGLERRKDRLDLYDDYGLLDNKRKSMKDNLSSLGKPLGVTTTSGSTEPVGAFGSMNNRDQKLQENWGRIGGSSGTSDNSKTAQEASKRYKHLFDEPEFDENGYVITR